MWQAILAINHRNIKLLLRQKQMIIQPVMIPLILLFLMVVIFGGGGDEWPVAIVDESNSLASQELVDAFEQSESNITPYFDILPIQEDQAKEMVAKGRLHLYIKIPEDFDDSHTIDINTYNINSDAMKNVRFRVEHTLNNYLVQRGELKITAEQFTAHPEDVWRSAYYGGSSVLLTLFLGSMMIAANLYAFEYENRTIKEIIMSPSGSIMAGFGIILTSIWMSIVLSFIPLLLSIVFLHFDFYFINTLLVYIAIIPLLVGFAGIGLLLAASFRQHRILQPIIILVTIGTYIIGGGFAGVNMLMPLARNIAEIWLFSIVFEWFNPILHNFSARLTIQQHVFILSAGAVGILLTFFAYRFKNKRAHTGGQ